MLTALLVVVVGVAVVGASEDDYCNYVGNCHCKEMASAVRCGLRCAALPPPPPGGLPLETASSAPPVPRSRRPN